MAPSQGNTQILPNGNLFVNWGQAGTITEYRANDSVPIFNAYLDTFTSGPGIQNYRGFRQEWVGKPTEPPALVALATKDDVVELYASWNGDTETRLWRFYLEVDNKKTLLGDTERTGFETSYRVLTAASGENVKFVAQALDREGRSLTLTKPATLRQKITQSSAADLRGKEVQQIIEEL